MRKVMFAVVAALAFAAAASGPPGRAYANSNGHEVHDVSCQQETGL
jgi:hypothetical protein